MYATETFYPGSYYRHLHVFTIEHISASRMMPCKQLPTYRGEETRQSHAKKAKRDRKAIADYYRAHRRENGRGSALRAHRNRLVTTGEDARRRLKQLS